MPTTPIALSDAQMDAILAASHSLPPDRRSGFLQDVAREISRHPILGDGLLHRVIMEVQRRHLDAPLETRTGTGKYR